MPEALPSIQHCLAQVKKAVGNVSKSQRNNQQGFNFRGIDDVVNAASGPLNEYGVITVPDIESYTYEVVEIGRNKTPMAHLMGLVRYTFTGPAGDSVTAKVLSESMDSGDKAAAKMMSVAYRIALLQVLNLPTDAPDPDLDSYERSSKESPQAASKGQPRPAPARTREPASNGSTASLKTIDELVSLARDAATVDDLNALFKKAGTQGALVSVIANPETGEAMTFQQYLYERNDAIKSSSGDSGAGKGKAAAR